jgi:hypothetical protein
MTTVATVAADARSRLRRLSQQISAEPGLDGPAMAARIAQALSASPPADTTEPRSSASSDAQVAASREAHDSPSSGHERRREDAP